MGRCHIPNRHRTYSDSYANSDGNSNTDRNRDPNADTDCNRDSYANSDRNCNTDSNGDSYANSDRNCNTDGNGDSYANSDRNCNTDSNGDSYPNGDRNSHSYGYTNCNSNSTPALSGLTYNGGTPFVNGTNLIAGTSYTITAQANANTRSVVFTRDGSTVKTDSAAPFDFTWTPTGLGNHTFTATPWSSTGRNGNQRRLHHCKLYGCKSVTDANTDGCSNCNADS